MSLLKKKGNKKVDYKFVQNSFNFNCKGKIKQPLTKNTVHGSSHNSCVVDMVSYSLAQSS